MAYMACHLIIFNLWFYDGNDLQQVLDRQTSLQKNKTAVKTRPQPWPAFKSQRRAPSAATAAPQKRLWNIYGKCHLAVEIGQTVDPWDTLQRWVVKGFLRSMCGICGKKNSFSGWTIETMASFAIVLAAPRLDEPWHGNVLLSSESWRWKVRRKKTECSMAPLAIQHGWEICELNGHLKKWENPSKIHRWGFFSHVWVLLVGVADTTVPKTCEPWHDITAMSEAMLLTVTSWSFNCTFCWPINELGYLNPSEFCQVCQSVRLGHRHEQIS